MFWILASVLVFTTMFCSGQEVGLPALPVLSQSLSSTVPCTCGIFLSGQFVKGSGKPPSGNPVMEHEYDHTYPCSSLGQRQCVTKCLQVIAKYLPNSSNLVCGTLDRDCYKERAYLWTKNCKDVWENSNMLAGREFCCKDNMPYTCSLGKQ